MLSRISMKDKDQLGRSKNVLTLRTASFDIFGNAEDSEAL